MAEGAVSVGGDMAGGVGAGAKGLAVQLPITRRKSFLAALAALSVSCGVVCESVCVCVVHVCEGMWHECEGVCGCMHDIKILMLNSRFWVYATLSPSSGFPN